MYDSFGVAVVWAYSFWPPVALTVSLGPVRQACCCDVHLRCGRHLWGVVLEAARLHVVFMLLTRGLRRGGGRGGKQGCHCCVVATVGCTKEMSVSAAECIV
jgi:hypothetical protein